MSVSATVPNAPTRGQLLDELDRVLNSDAFRYSYRMIRLLRFLVEHTLEFPTRPLNEHLLAVRVFDKPASFDSRTDPIVRVEASRLRAKLRDYYHGEGAHHRVFIHLPRRGYRPVLALQHPPADEVTEPGRGRTQSQPQPAAAADATPSLLVLPFLDLSAGRSEECFCDGLAEELINLLARVNGLRVVARTSAFRFKGADIDLSEIAERLQVSAILEGSVRREGDVVRVSVQLLNAADSYHIWSETYQRPLRHVFSLQNEITQAIAGALKAKLEVQAEGDLAPAGKRDDSEAYHRYLKALHAWRRRTGEGFARAISLLEQAASEDPEDARIHAKLAYCQIGLLLSTASIPKETLRLTERYAERALELFPGMGEALSARAFVRAVRDRDWEVCESEFLRAIDQAPGDPTIHEWYAMVCLAPHRRFEAAIAHLGKALDLDPVSVSVRSHMAMIFYLQRRYDSAARELELALDLEPDFYRGRFDLGMVYTELGRYEEALESFRLARRSNPESRFRLGALGYCYGRAGMRREARDLLDEHCTGTAGKGEVSSHCLAQVFAGLGEMSEALEMLRRAAEERAFRVIWLSSEATFDGLRHAEGFGELCRTLRLAYPEFRTLNSF